MQQRAKRRQIDGGSPWEDLAGYARAVVDGEWVFVSGTLGQDFSTLEFPATAAEQAELALDHIEAALEQVPARWADVVRMRVYVPNRSDIAAVSDVIKRRLHPTRPTNTTVCCPLAVEEAKVEVEVTARLRGIGGNLPDNVHQGTSHS